MAGEWLALIMGEGVFIFSWDVCWMAGLQACLFACALHLTLLYHVTLQIKTGCWLLQGEWAYCGGQLWVQLTRCS